MNKRFKTALATIGAALFALSLTTASYAGSLGIGIAGSMNTLDTSGSETQRQTGTVASTSVSEEVDLPEMFAEYVADNNFAVGLSYIPVQELGSKSRTDTDMATATNTASAELDNMFMLYVEVPIYAGLYVKGGMSSVTIVTTEVLGTGSSYDDQNVMGTTLGVGYKMGFGDSGFYGKIEYLETEYDGYDDDSAGNKVTADTETETSKISLGYKF